MHNFKKNLKKILFSEIMLALLGLAIVILISIPMSKKIIKQYSANKEIEQYEKKYDELQTKNLELKKMVEYLESDQFVEEQARLKLNLKKEDEEVVVISSNDTKEVDNESFNDIYDIDNVNQPKKIKNIPNPNKWLNYFLN